MRRAGGLPPALSTVKDAADVASTSPSLFDGLSPLEISFCYVARKYLNFHHGLNITTRNVDEMAELHIWPAPLPNNPSFS